MDTELTLQISEEGADAEQLAALAGYLRADLLELNVGDVAAVRTGEAPPGTLTAVGGLTVTFGQSAASLRSVLAAIRDWLRRNGGTGRAVRLEFVGDALELTKMGTADQERLIEVFVSRHTEADSRGVAAFPPCLSAPRSLAPVEWGGWATWE